MELSRWRNRFGVPALVVLAAFSTALVPASLAAGGFQPKSWPAGNCPAFDPLATARAATSRSVPRADVADEMLLSALGELAGRRLQIGPAGKPALTITLPAESFVAPLTGSLLVYGWGSPEASEVRGLDLESGCDFSLARPTGIVRSALIDATGSWLYVHSVTAAERRDAGVSAYDLATGGLRQVTDPVPVSELFGPTFSTTLSWSIDGSQLAVQSCGFALCRTHVLDVASGEVSSNDAGHGPLIGFTRQALFVLADLGGLPSALLAIDRHTGAVSTLADEAFGAVLEAQDGGSRLLIDTPAGAQEVTL
jgi:hypothetical protein